MIFLYYYLIFSLILGCVLTYKVVDYYGWDDLHEDFNNRLEKDNIEPISLKMFQNTFIFVVPITICVIWPVIVWEIVKKW